MYMKLTLTFFGNGLLNESFFILISYYIFKPNQSTAHTVDEMIASLEDEGYRIITEDEYISFTLNEKDNNAEKTEDEEKNDEQKDTSKDKKDGKDKKKKKKKDKKKTYTIEIDENTLPSTISERLEENGIIDDAMKFNQYLEDKDYSPYIQIGKYKLSSDMSRKEIAEELTDK